MPAFTSTTAANRDDLAAFASGELLKTTEHRDEKCVSADQQFDLSPAKYAQLINETAKSIAQKLISAHGPGLLRITSHYAERHCGEMIRVYLTTFEKKEAK